MALISYFPGGSSSGGGGGAAGMVNVDITLAASGWSNSRQTVTIDEVLVTSVGMADTQSGVSSAQRTAAENAGFIIESFTTSSVTFYCLGTVPTIDIPMTVSLFEEEANTDKGGLFCSIPMGLPEKRALNDMTWYAISLVSKFHQGPNYFSIGDRKSVLINGTIGTLSLNTTLWTFIIGFDHNSEKEGAGITFQGFKTAQTGGKDVGLCDSYYGSYQSYNGTKYFQMNHWGTSSNYNTNYGGWKGCDMRYDILGSTNKAPSGYGSQPATSRVGYDAEDTTATDPVANTLMAALPEDLRAVMKPMAIYTDNKGNSSNTAANVTTSVDYLPLLAEFEIFGARSYANQYEKAQQVQYAYYANGNSKVKYKHNGTSTAAFWWERSPFYNSATGFCLVDTDGDAGISYASLSSGLAPCFRV